MEEVEFEISFESISKYEGRKAAETQQGSRRGGTWSAEITLLDNRLAGKFCGEGSEYQ